jgi:hypothetical protein
MRKGCVLLLSLMLVCLTLSAQTNREFAVKKYPKNVISAMAKIVDLVVSNCRFEPMRYGVGLCMSGYYAFVTIANSGNPGASFQAGQTIASIKIAGTTWGYIAEGGGYYVPGHSGAEIKMHFCAPPGNYTAMVTANPDHIVAESDFSNNVKEFQVQVEINNTSTTTSPPSLPDLVISRITAQPPSGPAGTIFEFTVTVTNRGDVVARASGSQQCRYTLDGSRFEYDETWGGIADLAVGQSVIHTVRMKNPPISGTHEFKAIVDPSNELSEKYENNNTGVCSFTVR